MNPLPPNADELVSAYLDGEAAPHEIFAVESSTELMARVASMRALAGRLGAPPVVPTQQKEAHIAAALGAFDAMFATTEGLNTDPATAAIPPELTSVPTPIPPASTVKTPPPSSTVTSLDAARERRKPRRFNVGVIAAALAALLVMVGFAVLSRGGANDVANSALQDGVAAADTAAESADFDDSAMADDAAMEEDATDLGVQGGLSESQEGRSTGVPEPTVAPPAAAGAPEAELDSDSAESGESLADQETTMADAEEEFAGDSADVVPEAFLFFMGTFGDDAEFSAELNRLGADGLLETALEQGSDQLFPCQTELSVLAGTEPIEIVAEAVIDDGQATTDLVQVYIQTSADGPVLIYVVDPADCSVLLVTEDVA